MKRKAILFDLDGTLLPMDQDVFAHAYMKGLAAKVAPLGYDPQKLVETIWAGTVAMMKNDGKCTNEAVFWDYFCGVFGEDARKDEPVFEDFYRNEFQLVRNSCGYQEKSARLIARIRELGFTVVLATNPLFPAIATQSRIRWAGMEPEDFAFVTTYENSSYCKPNPDYYREILNKMDLDPKECVMVGNDVGEDMIAEKLGMKVFLLTDCLINRDNKDISAYPQGSFDALEAFVENLA